MQNKGAITLLAVALALVSLYQLFFTYKTNQVENAAKEFANGNPIKEKEYLDSVANQPVYNFLGLAKFTYKECKELDIVLRILAGVKKILTVICGNGPVIVLTGTVNACERLLVEEAYKTVLKSDLLHYLHCKSVLVSSNV